MTDSVKVFIGIQTRAEAPVPRDHEPHDPKSHCHTSRNCPRWWLISCRPPQEFWTSLGQEENAVTRTLLLYFFVTLGIRITPVAMSSLGRCQGVRKSHHQQAATSRAGYKESHCHTQFSGGAPWSSDLRWVALSVEDNRRRTFCRMSWNSLCHTGMSSPQVLLLS